MRTTLNKMRANRAERLVSVLYAIFCVTALYGQGGVGYENGHEWVDLGLSVKWATCNVGASSPSDYGNYFAWGEIVPKGDYSFEKYKFRNADGNISKYNTESDNGFVDNMIRLDLSDDAAQAWWGGKWRMPTKTEFDELVSNCTCTWSIQGGKNGYKVTSNKNGNSIFLPAAGEAHDTYIYEIGSDGRYWSSSLSMDAPYRAWYLGFSSFVFITDYYFFFRYMGFSVRPVME